MDKKYVIVVVILFAMALLGACSTGTDTNDNSRLNGVWQEEFAYRAIPARLDDSGSPEITSELTLEDGRFRVRFSPLDTLKAHVLVWADSVNPDTASFIYFPDSVYQNFPIRAILPLKALYEGAYTLKDGIITFFPDGFDFERAYSYRVDGNRLFLETWPVSLSLAEFIWANAAMKSSGTFSRISR